MLIFFIPFAAALIFFVVFETCDYWGLKGRSDYMQRGVASSRELLMKKPENIVLGDSRMANLNSRYIEETSGEKYLIMAFGGATLNDNINQFWFAAEHTTLKKVVIGLDFYRLNSNNFAVRYEKDYLPFVESPLKYVGALRYWVSAIENFRFFVRDAAADVTGNETLRLVKDDPSAYDAVDPELTTETENGYRKDLYEYTYVIADQTLPYGNLEEYLMRLEEIASYCGENGIELTFVIPNVNRAVWDLLIRDGELFPFIEMYKDRLKSIADVYDLEFDNEFAREDKNFLDGLHYTKENKLWLARVVFADEDSPYCEYTTPEQYAAKKLAKSE